MMYSLAAKVQTNSEKKTTKLYFHTQVFTGDPIIPAKVLEELDKLKLKNNIDKNALNTAARNINLAFTKQFSKMEDADISLLPVGFDKNNPDCQILSVALKYKGENPIILTSDNILQTRANGLGITTISLTDFLRQLR